MHLDRDTLAQQRPLPRPGVPDRRLDRRRPAARLLPRRYLGTAPLFTLLLTIGGFVGAMRLLLWSLKKTSPDRISWDCGCRTSSGCTSGCSRWRCAPRYLSGWLAPAQRAARRRRDGRQLLAHAPARRRGWSRPTAPAARRSCSGSCWPSSSLFVGLLALLFWRVPLDAAGLRASAPRCCWSPASSPRCARRRAVAHP